MGIIYTIGYEQTEIGSFIGTLKEVGIELLADVRAVALSRKKGFSKTALSGCGSDWTVWRIQACLQSTPQIRRIPGGIGVAHYQGEGFPDLPDVL